MHPLVIAVTLAALSSGPVEPQIVRRDEWGAKPHLPGAIAHTIERLTVHHTGVKSNPARSLEEKLRGLQTFSQREDKLANGKTKPAWPDIPYHYYISIDGRIGEGREWFFAGDTNTEYNPNGHLLIVVEGEFGVEKPTEPQIASLKSLTTYCCWLFRLRSDQIASHKDYSKETECPGASLYVMLNDLRAHVKTALGR